MNKFCTLKSVFKEIYTFEQTLQKTFGLTINEIMTLCSISTGRPTSSAIAKELGVSFPRMSKIISELENKGFIKKNADKTDKRKTILSLSIKGKSKMSSIKESSVAFPQIRVVRKKKKIEPITSFR